MPKLDLDSAYGLHSIEDTRELYANWADTYDSEFARKMDFLAPAKAAEAFKTAGGTGPVLDFGCGTGLVGEHLVTMGIGPIDGADLSKEMLAVAESKGCYRNLESGNVLDGYSLGGAPYRGVVSCGTFTNGHVGPEAIDVLLSLAGPDALFVLTINAEHFTAADFAGYFESRKDKINQLELPTFEFYGANASGPHKDDLGYMAQFTKAG